jgi:hypothetical protein
MPKFLVEASYTIEGLQGLQKDKASGLARTRTTALLTIAEMEEALGRRPDYRGPGQQS